MTRSEQPIQTDEEFTQIESNYILLQNTKPNLIPTKTTSVASEFQNEIPYFKNKGLTKGSLTWIQTSCLFMQQCDFIRKQKSNDSWPLYKPSFMWSKPCSTSFLFVACASDRFHKVHGDTFGNESLTSTRRAEVLVSCDKYAWGAKTINVQMQSDARLTVLNSGQESGYWPDAVFDKVRHFVDEYACAYVIRMATCWKYRNGPRRTNVHVRRNMRSCACWPSEILNWVKGESVSMKWYFYVRAQNLPA